MKTQPPAILAAQRASLEQTLAALQERRTAIINSDPLWYANLPEYDQVEEEIQMVEVELVALRHGGEA